jgi:tRNA threonylcarbamoyladenosine biosynthesis protein TsaE
MQVTVATPDDMQALGERVASVLARGDLVVLSGSLGAGKTTLAQGIGRGLAVEGAVVSPTFVIARVHRGRLPLVHVDAYRLSSIVEVDDLDLDASLDESVTLVEWGEGLVEGLSGARLEIRIVRPEDDSDETRTVTIHAVGERWEGIDLATVAGAAGGGSAVSR